MKTIHIQLSDELHAELKSAAYADRRTVNSYVRVLVERQHPLKVNLLKRPAHDVQVAQAAPPPASVEAPSQIERVRRKYIPWTEERECTWQSVRYRLDDQAKEERQEWLTNTGKIIDADGIVRAIS